MRLTCLKCGHQFEIAADPGGATYGCVCGTQFENPGVLNTGVQPSAKAAEHSRRKAFRAAGLVRNVGGFAFGLVVLGLLFFPLALVGAAGGLYCLTMMRGPLGRYSGRTWAVAGLVGGVLVFTIEGAVALSWLEQRRMHQATQWQRGASDDLKVLRRAQVLFRATNDTYGGLADFRFRPVHGRYTIYLGPDDFAPGQVDGAEVVEPLPEGFTPSVAEDDFTAVAVANLDDDPDLDVWVITAGGSPLHAQDDLGGEAVASAEETEGAPTVEELLEQGGADGEEDADESDGDGGGQTGEDEGEAGGEDGARGAEGASDTDAGGTVAGDSGAAAGQGAERARTATSTVQNP